MRRALWGSLILVACAATGLFAQSPPPDPIGPPADTLPSLPSATSGPDAKPFVDRLNLPASFEVRGRIETEAVVSQQSQMSQDAIGNLVNGYGFRRVRLGAQGSYGDSTSWVSEVELAGGSVRLRDVFVGLDALPGVRQVRVGHFREPYSLEGMTSSNFITFTERSPLNNLSPARNWGVCGFWWPDSERLLFSTGVFRDGTDSSGQSIGDGDNWSYTSRLTGLPIYESGDSDFRLLHLGMAFTQRVPPNGVLSFQPRTASNLITVNDNPGSPFLPPVDIRANCYQGYNLQAAYVHGPFSLQTEWSAAAVQQTDAGVVFVSGVYVYGSFFLTGEHRGYNRTRGSFDQVNVKRPVIRSKSDSRGGYGAIELTSRFSYLDFNSTNLPLDVNGNPAQTRLYEVTTGVNWYLNDYTRIMVNHTVGIPDKIGDGRTVAHIFSIRTAIFW
jgi:phosphate-selective porin OprO/OprP